MTALLIAFAVYVLGMFCAAFLVGRLSIRLHDMPVGVFALFWPVALAMCAFDSTMTAVARFGERLRGDEK
jgi:predicted tellurium resistance membrane protein TerC